MKIKQIIESIQAHDKIIIHRHVRPDPDAYGSQAGLGEILRISFPEKSIYVVGEEDPSLDFLVTMDHISDTVYEGALVIVCDTANTPRISDQRYNKGAALIKIDHHPNHDPYGDIVWVDTEASSTSEMIYEFYQTAKEYGFNMNDQAAKLIYAGIVGDTGRFLFPNTTAKTFSYAEELIQYDFNRTALYNGLYKIKDNIARLRGYVLSHFKLEESGMCSIKLQQDILEKYDVTTQETGQLVQTLSDIEGMKAWVFFIEESDCIRVRLRSKGPIINTIAQQFNGGGHPLASGATVDSWEEADRLIQELDRVCAAYGH